MKKILRLLAMTALLALALMLLGASALGEEKAFTLQPANCTVPINGSATVSWEMNFVPDKLELRTYNDNFGTDLVDTLSRLYDYYRFN